jgi:hypothetical protein
MEHGMALRSPWYVCERGTFDRFDPRAQAPEIQKYDTSDFVERLVRDPRDSLQFDATDRWAVPVPTGPRPPDVPTGKNPDGTTRFEIRRYLSTHRLVHTPVRKLYQPSHERFYAVTVELFCDQPGLPRPGPANDVTVKCVMRRWRTTIRPRKPGEEEAAAAVQRVLTRAFAKEVMRKGYPEESLYDPDDDSAREVTGLIDECLDGGPRVAAFRAKHAAQFRQLIIERVLEGWYVRQGVGGWAPVPADQAPDDPWAVPARDDPTQDDPVRDASAAVSESQEQELSMWRVPASAAGCPAAATRSLWFGVVPTYSAEFDPERQPKLDEHTIYVLYCVARRRRTPPHQDCPPIETWSAASRPFRLAAFFDPAGNANRQVRVKLPDLQALAAHAGSPVTGGGVQFERPARSQLSTGPLGVIPTSGGKVGGDSAEICSFAIELITIVASFVLALFLPVVVFAFQLWWLLLLKFCWPPSAEITAVVKLLGTQSIDSMDNAHKLALSRALGADDDVTPALKTALGPLTGNSKGAGAALVTTLNPEVPPKTSAPAPKSRPPDPLCRVTT